MQLRDLTKEQVQKICDYYHDKYDNGQTDTKSFCAPCRHCPFGYAIDDSYWRECCGFTGFVELPKEVEEIIKNGKD